jgi:hypothetical protein
MLPDRLTVSRRVTVSEKRRGIWEAAQCALVLVDYQPEMFDHIDGQDPKLVERC